LASFRKMLWETQSLALPPMAPAPRRNGPADAHLNQADAAAPLVAAAATDPIGMTRLSGA
jgi:hypothetical protein